MPHALDEGRSMYSLLVSVFNNIERCGLPPPSLVQSERIDKIARPTLHPASATLTQH